MLEVSRVVDGRVGNLGLSCPRMHSSEESVKEQAHKLCRDYLHGAWLTISPHEMIFKKMSGGLSNYIYYCALPESVSPVAGEPSRLLVRFYGSENSQRAIETLVTESVIFTLLSESQRGPRLYGVFSGGRLEEYISARPLFTKELVDPQISGLIADKMAQIHLMDVPINKQPKWLWHTIERWIKQINENIDKDEGLLPSPDVVHTLKELNLNVEFEWLKKFLLAVQSPVVFCHNDLQEGNILLRKSAELDDQGRPTNSDHLVVIDFEYCAYNYRGFEFGNHFCEWLYDYTREDPPYFYELQDNRATTLHIERLAKFYLDALKKYPEYKEKPEDTVENIVRETEAFILASHFFWGLWSLIHSTSRTTFDYWGYGESRFREYYKRKSQLFSTEHFPNS